MENPYAPIITRAKGRRGKGTPRSAAAPTTDSSRRVATTTRPASSRWTADLSPEDITSWPATGPLTYLITVISLKIGRYMATTIPPTTTPRKTIRTGSRSDVIPATAVSTSSS